MGSSDDTSVTRFGPGVIDRYIIHFVTKGRGYAVARLVVMDENEHGCARLRSGIKKRLCEKGERRAPRKSVDRKGLWHSCAQLLTKRLTNRPKFPILSDQSRDF